jgi:glycosyltransferase involved in cell wall biosynthesis
VSKSLLIWVSRTYSNMADRVVVPAAPIKALLESYGVEAPIDVVPTDVRLRPAGAEEGAGIRARLAIAPDDRVLLFVGRLAREKNIALLLDAFARVHRPGLHLVLVGDGPSREWLEERARTLGLGEAVVFVGAVERDTIAAWYRAADLFVFPSLTETQGLVVEEALQLGVPTLAVGAGGVLDVLARWPGGRMVEPGEGLVERFAAALEALLEPQGGLEALRRAAAHNGEEPSGGRSTRQLLRVYEAAISCHPRTPRKPRRRARKAVVSAR